MTLGVPFTFLNLRAVALMGPEPDALLFQFWAKYVRCMPFCRPECSSTCTYECVSGRAQALFCMWCLFTHSVFSGSESQRVRSVCDGYEQSVGLRADPEVHQSPGSYARC